MKTGMLKLSFRHIYKTKNRENLMKIEVSDLEFEKKVLEKSEKIPVLVDFWAAWCGPCRILGPTLEKLAKEYEGKFVLAKVDVQENQKWASKFEITSIPSIKLFKKGKIVDSFIGSIPESYVKDFLKKNNI